MYFLYGNAGSASASPQCLMELAGLPCELIQVDLSAEDRPADYLAINPYGRVPTLLIDGAPVFESAAICLYLADRHPDSGLAPATDSPDRAVFLQWLMFLTNTLQEFMMQGFYPERCITAPDQTANVAAAAAGRVGRAMGVVG